MAWVKKGLIYKPSAEAEWMKSHAQVPIALLLEDRIRIYISVRPNRQISLLTFIDVDISNPAQILYVHKEPLLPLGKPGTFDEFGTMPGCVVNTGDEIRLYTTGWQRGQTVPYINSIGLAISRDNGKTFARPFDGPVLSVTPFQPYSTMAPYVMRDQKGWHMWHGAGTDWIEIEGKYEPIYNIFYAHSEDGINWARPDICCLPDKAPEEAASRPSVIFENNLYHMWFSYRSQQDFRGGKGSYRIGYASSTDGKNWKREDNKAGITVNDGGWDSEMVEYANVIDTPAGRYMFYNGNGFGETGFGYAIWQD